MANFEYVTANKLTRDAHGYKNTNRILVALVGLGIAFIVSAIYLPATPLVLLLVVAALWAQKSSAILLAGAQGEDLVLDLLRQLPDTFTVYNQVDIPNAKSRTGFNEADVIVAGPNAIFVIEVKHNNGRITGADTDPEWQIKKLSRIGNVYGKTMRNPLFQVKRLVWLLSKDLKAKRSRAWIQGIVLFSHHEVTMSIDNNSNVPVLGSSDLVNYINAYQAKYDIANLDKVISDIAALKGA